MILHVDMDAFYAAIEQRDNPNLVGKPVVVGGSPTGRGVIAAASYEARKFGLHSAMPSARAIRLCPHAIFIKPQIEKYSAVSKQIREIFNRFTPVFEPLALDEAFLDVTGSEKLFGDAQTIGRKIQAAIAEELQLVAPLVWPPINFSPNSPVTSTNQTDSWLSNRPTPRNFLTHSTFHASGALAQKLKKLSNGSAYNESDNLENSPKQPSNNCLV